MNKELEQLYNAVKQMEDLGLPVSKDQMKRMEQAEKSYVEDELLSCLKAVATPLLDGLRQPLTLIVDYTPEQGIVVKTGNRKIGRVGRKPKKQEEGMATDAAAPAHEIEIRESGLSMPKTSDKPAGEPQNYWILVCNPKYYNIREAFANLKTLFWTKVRNMKSIQVGDIVFVYVTKPEMKIMYMAEVLDAHVDYKDRRADEEEEYDREERAHETTPTELVEIRFIQSCDNNGLSLAALREKGFTGSLQTPQTIKNDELRKYIQSFFV